MRKIIRSKLSSASLGTLAKMQSSVDQSTSPGQRADALWKSKTNSAPRRRAFDEVRQALSKMARGRCRCMYCEDNLGTDIEHFRPKAAYPDATFKWDNYLLACSHCNSNGKRTQFPLDVLGNTLLLDPSRDDPYLHLAFVPETGWLSPVTSRGTETERVFGLNRREELTLGRADVWAALERIVSDIAQAPSADVVHQLIAQAKRLSFQSVVHHFIRDGLSARPSFVSSRHSRILKANPRIWSWAI